MHGGLRKNEREDSDAIKPPFVLKREVSRQFSRCQRQPFSVSWLLATENVIHGFSKSIVRGYEQRIQADRGHSLEVLSGF